MTEPDDRKRNNRAFHFLQWGLVLTVLLVMVWACGHGADSAVRYAGAAASNNNAAQYQVSGVIRDYETGSPVPWAEVAAANTSSTTFFHATADVNRAFTLLTLPERHSLTVHADGYPDQTTPIGPPWFTIFRRKTETIEIKQDADKRGTDKAPIRALRYTKRLNEKTKKHDRSEVRSPFQARRVLHAAGPMHLFRRSQASSGFGDLRFQPARERRGRSG